MVHEKNSMIAQEQRELKNKWQLERNELESSILQLTAQQTQLVGTIRKKDADFERLQIYLQKSAQSSSQRPAPPSSSSSSTSMASSSTALVVVSSNAPTTLSSTSIGLVISKPLSNSSSHTQPPVPTHSARDTSVCSLTQLLRESQVRDSTID